MALKRLLHCALLLVFEREIPPFDGQHECDQNAADVEAKVPGTAEKAKIQKCGYEQSKLHMN